MKARRSSLRPTSPYGHLNVNARITASPRLWLSLANPPRPMEVDVPLRLPQSPRLVPLTRDSSPLMMPPSGMVNSLGPDEKNERFYYVLLIFPLWNKRPPSSHFLLWLYILQYDQLSWKPFLLPKIQPSPSHTVSWPMYKCINIYSRLQQEDFHYFLVYWGLNLCSR